jgi:hypothetical protein
MNRLVLVLPALLLAVGRAEAAENAFRPFTIDWQGSAQSPADVSFLLDPPAGKDGFIRVSKGHLVRADGARLRIWGINATGRAGIPAKEHAPLIAAHLARVGLNCVRFHFLDRPAPQGLIDAGRDDTRALDPAQLDRLDSFVAELKQRGIYTNLNLNVGRSYKAGDGLSDYELLGFAKTLNYFDPRVLALHKEYAQQLLAHYNPYTRSEYRHEPAVAIVELVNENSLVEAWMKQRLLGKNTRKNPGTWSDIPASYEKALTERYNAWLGDRLSAEALRRWRAAAGVSGEGPIPRLRPDEFARAAAERFRTEAAFYIELEAQYFQQMARYLREELGVKSLLVATSDHNHGSSGYPLLSSSWPLDVVDGHVYWQHPRYLTDSATGRRQGFEISNTPMVDNPFRSTVVELSRSAVAGKPYTVSEVNHPFPSEYACEGIPILAAYAALHDWDGVFWYTLAHADIVEAEAKVAGHFDFAFDPVKMTQLAAGALLFGRGDVRPAARTVGRSYSQEQVYESIRLPASEIPYFTPGFPLAIPLVHAMRITSLAGPPTEHFEGAPGEPIRSDTGELAWFHAGDKRGLVTVETERSQALVGIRKGERQQVKNLAAQGDVPFAAVTLSSLDDRPIGRSGKLLLTAAARAANSNIRWNAKRTSLEDWGSTPTCIEPVTGTVTLRNLENAVAVRAQALDGAGRPLGAAISATKTADGWSFALGDPATTWYVITVGRGG